MKCLFFLIHSTSPFFPPTTLNLQNIPKNFISKIVRVIQNPAQRTQRE